VFDPPILPVVSVVLFFPNLAAAPLQSRDFVRSNTAQ